MDTLYAAAPDDLLHIGSIYTGSRDDTSSTRRLGNKLRQSVYST